MRWLFIRGWNGEEPLWKIVWIYGVVLCLLAKAAVPVLRVTEHVDLDNPVGAQVCFIGWTQALYCGWMLVALWRCAFNAKREIWGYLVRPLVVLYILLFFVVSSIEEKPAAPKEVLIQSGIALQKQATQWLHYKPARSQ